jgi:hypothetical protein
MMVFQWIEEPFVRRASPWWVAVLAGVAVALLGVLIVAMPQILVALAAGFVISAGISLVALGLQLKQTEDLSRGRIGRPAGVFARWVEWR